MPLGDADNFFVEIVLDEIRPVLAKFISHFGPRCPIVTGTRRDSRLGLNQTDSQHSIDSASSRY